MSEPMEPAEAPVAEAAPAAPAAPPAPASPPTDDLDSILASIREYREDTASPVEPQRQRGADDHGQRSPGAAQTGGHEDPAPRQAADNRDFDNRRVAAIEARIVRDDIGRATDAMKAAQPALAAIGGDVLEAYLNSQAIRDSRISTAWNNRDRDPATFNKVVTGLARRFASGLPVPVDTAAAGERGAAITAARGSTQQVTADAEDNRVLALSDAEFDEFYAKQARAS